MNRVPWASNDTTLPTDLATRTSTPTYAATTPATFPDHSRYENESSTVRKCLGLMVVGPREERTPVCPACPPTPAGGHTSARRP